MAKHVRLHWADSIRDCCPFMDAHEMIDVPRTLWFEEYLDLNGDNDLANCERIWYLFNRVTADNYRPELDTREQRSMCIGDVVEFVEPGNSRFYMAVDVGFKAIEGIRSKSPQDR